MTGNPLPIDTAILDGVAVAKAGLRGVLKADYPHVLADADALRAVDGSLATIVLIGGVNYRKNTALNSQSDNGLSLIKDANGIAFQRVIPPAGSDGVDPGYLYDYGTSLGGDNLDLSLATALSVSKVTRGGSDVGARILELDPAGNSTLNSIILTDPASEAQASFRVTAAVDVGAFVILFVTGHAGATGFSAGPISLQREISGASAGGTTDDVEYDAVQPGSVAAPVTLRLRTELWACADFGCVRDAPLTDTLTEMQAFLDAVAATGFVGRIEPGRYVLDGTPVITPVSDIPVLSIQAHGAIFDTVDTGAFFGLQIARGGFVTQIDQFAIAMVDGLTVDHINKVNVLRGYDVVGRPNVILKDCRIVGGSFSGVVPNVNYAGFRFDQSDVNDTATGAFWARLIRPRATGGSTRMPRGFQVLGSCNAMNIEAPNIWNTDVGIQLQGVSATRPIPNGVVISHGSFEGMTDAIRYIGLTGVSSIVGHKIHHNRAEAISNAFINLTGIDIDHPSERGLDVGPNTMITSVNSFIVNPNNLRVNTREEGVGAATIDPPFIGANATATIGTITVRPAVAAGDWVQIDCSGDLLGLVATGFVSAANTVTVRLSNPTSGAINLGSLRWRARVRPRGGF